MNKKLLPVIIGVIALLIGGGVGFFTGIKYQESKTSNRQFNFANQTFMGRGNTARFGDSNTNTMVIRGQIISKDDKSITIKLQDGGTKIIILGTNTTIAKSETGSTNDLTNDEAITVFGNTNSDGSITAQNIQIGNVSFGLRNLESPIPSGTSSSQ